MVGTASPTCTQKFFCNWFHRFPMLIFHNSFLLPKCLLPVGLGWLIFSSTTFPSPASLPLHPIHHLHHTHHHPHTHIHRLPTLFLRRGGGMVTVGGSQSFRKMQAHQASTARRPGATYNWGQVSGIVSVHAGALTHYARAGTGGGNGIQRGIVFNQNKANWGNLLIPVSKRLTICSFFGGKNIFLWNWILWSFGTKSKLTR